MKNKKNQLMTSVGGDKWEKGHFPPVGGIVAWCKDCGNKCGVSSKTRNRGTVKPST